MCSYAGYIYIYMCVSREIELLKFQINFKFIYGSNYYYAGYIHKPV